MLISVAWAALAASSAVGLEAAYRSDISWWGNLWWILPVIVLLNFGIYQLLNTEMGWLPSIVLFGAMTASLRLVVAFTVVHEPVTLANLIAGAALATVALSRIVWR